MFNVLNVGKYSYKTSIYKLKAFLVMIIIKGGGAGRNKNDKWENAENYTLSLQRKRYDF